MICMSITPYLIPRRLKSEIPIWLLRRQGNDRRPWTQEGRHPALAVAIYK